MIVAIVGAESTGKTSLATALASLMSIETGLDCIAVPEWLRLWCEREGRTPYKDEQVGIAQTQQYRLLEAAQSHPLVIADTTPLMTAVYSDFLFGDLSLYPFALAFHRNHCDVTLLTAIDIAWTADGFQRDGPQVREPTDCLLRAALDRGGLTWSCITGIGSLRVDAAAAALTTQLSKIGLVRNALPDRFRPQGLLQATENSDSPRR